MSNVNAMATKIEKTITKRTAELLQRRYPIRNHRWVMTDCGTSYAMPELSAEIEFSAEVSELEGDARTAGERSLRDPWGRPFKVSLSRTHKYTEPQWGFNILQEPHWSADVMGYWIIQTTVAGQLVRLVVFNS